MSTTELWLTYQEAAEKFGISSEAVRQRARRFRWRTQPGNDGKVKVLVPGDFAVQSRKRPTVRPDVQTGGQPPDNEALSGLFTFFRAEIDQVQRRHAEEIEALKKDHGAAVAQMRQDHAAELERVGQSTAQQRQDHAAELERREAAHKAEVDRLQGTIEKLMNPPSWWKRLLGKG